MSPVDTLVRERNLNSRRMSKKFGSRGLTPVRIEMYFYVAIPIVTPNRVRWLTRIVLDVGGGLRKDTEENALSNIPLRWMLREILRARCHIRFDESALELWNIPSATIEQVPMTREPSDSTLRGDETDLALGQEMPDKDLPLSGEEANASTSTSVSIIRHSVLPPSPHVPVDIHDALDVVDAVQEMGSAFKKNPFWWILEVIPTYHEWQNEEDEWVGKLG